MTYGTRYRGWWRNWRGYASALLFTGAAFALRFELSTALQDYSCFLLFAPSAMLASWLGGLPAGLISFVVGLVLGDYFFVPRVGHFGPHRIADIAQILSYCITTFVGLGLIEYIQIARHDAQLAAEEARLRNSLLEKEVAERKRIQTALESAQAELRQHSAKLEELVAHRTAKLEQTIAALEGFCYTIAHDLRAPLRATDGFARALLEDYGPRLDEAGVDFAQRICAASKRMDGMIQELLDYGKLATCSCSLGLIDLDQPTQTAVQRHSDQIHVRNANLKVQTPLGTAHANATLLEQTIERLLANALKFTQPNCAPVVRIWSVQSGTSVRLCISDEGIGIAAEHLSKIFEPFSRLHGQETYPGTGMGLAFVRRSAERMGGRAGAESTPGKGSCFWIELRCNPG